MFGLVSLDCRQEIFLFLASRTSPQPREIIFVQSRKIFSNYDSENSPKLKKKGKKTGEMSVILTTFMRLPSKEIKREANQNVRLRLTYMYYITSHRNINLYQSACVFSLLQACIFPVVNFVTISIHLLSAINWPLITGASQRLEPVIKCCLFLSFFQCLVSRAPLSAVTKSLS